MRFGTGVSHRCLSLEFTPLAPFRSHGSRPHSASYHNNVNFWKWQLPRFHAHSLIHFLNKWHLAAKLTYCTFNKNIYFTFLVFFSIKLNESSVISIMPQIQLIELNMYFIGEHLWSSWLLAGLLFVYRTVPGIRAGSSVSKRKRGPPWSCGELEVVHTGGVGMGWWCSVRDPLKWSQYCTALRTALLV